MKIESTGPIRSTPGGRRTERAAGGGDFARHLDQAGTAAQVTGARPMGGIDSILALQEVDTATERRARARRRGDLMLDKLEELRIALLSGTMSRDSLMELAASLRARREDCGDPRLQSVLDEIELRAAVELAKLEAAGVR